MSDVFSAIISTHALILAETRLGRAEASTTRAILFTTLKTISTRLEG